MLEGGRFFQQRVWKSTVFGISKSKRNVLTGC